jgi:hypothetical protein
LEFRNHCFGQVHSEPADWFTLIRNGILAASVVWQGQLDPGPEALGRLGNVATGQPVTLVQASVEVADLQPKM